MDSISRSLLRPGETASYLDLSLVLCLILFAVSKMDLHHNPECPYRDFPVPGICPFNRQTQNGNAEKGHCGNGLWLPPSVRLPSWLKYLL